MRQPANQPFSLFDNTNYYALSEVQEGTAVVISIINRMVDRQGAVIQPLCLFVDEDYNDYDSTRQAIVQLFSLFDDLDDDDDDDDYNDYEL